MHCKVSLTTVAAVDYSGALCTWACQCARLRGLFCDVTARPYVLTGVYR